MHQLTNEEILKIIYPNRYDIAVKYKYFSDLHKGVKSISASKGMYQWHINKRTGGKEPKSQKITLADYIDACYALLRSMDSNGYNEFYPIKIDSNYNLHGGAHRLSCAVLLHLPICAEVKVTTKTPRLWDKQWFIDKGLDNISLVKIECYMLELMEEVNNATR